MESYPHEHGRSHLPAILCLHGAGTSARIFRFQARNIASALKDHFRFVFLDAPVKSQPGPNVLPYFESVPPYWRWVTNIGRDGGSGTELEKREIKEVDQLLRRVIAEKEGGGAGKFVGVMGFSQGCRVAAGLLLRQREWALTGHVDESFPKFRFGLFVGGGYPPIRFTDGPVQSEAIDVPTVHAAGRDDPQFVPTMKLISECSALRASEYEFTGGHHMPMVMAESRLLANLVLDAYTEGSKVEEERDLPQAV
ncbi:MAG: hypothetical protein Q9227_001305 [Pyrenula ochraceoflavens]